jgi:hypothetical protein
MHIQIISCTAMSPMMNLDVHKRVAETWAQSCPMWRSFPHSRTWCISEQVTCPSFIQTGLDNQHKSDNALSSPSAHLHGACRRLWENSVTDIAIHTCFYYRTQVQASVCTTGVVEGSFIVTAPEFELRFDHQVQLKVDCASQWLVCV